MFFLHIPEISIDKTTMAAYVVVPCLDGEVSPKNREQCTVNSVMAYINTQSSQ